MRVLLVHRAWDRHSQVTSRNPPLLPPTPALLSPPVSFCVNQVSCQPHVQAAQRWVKACVLGPLFSTSQCVVTGSVQSGWPGGLTSRRAQDAAPWGSSGRAAARDPGRLSTLTSHLLASAKTLRVPCPGLGDLADGRGGVLPTSQDSWRGPLPPGRGGGCPHIWASPNVPTLFPTSV